MRHRGTRGLTLIELVVAMSVFALIAVMGLQAMSGSMRIRDRLVAVDDETARLGFAVALIRADLSALVPMLFYAPGARPQSAVDYAQGGAQLGLSLAGQSDLSLRAGATYRRAEWRFDAPTGRLSRRQWPALYPATAGDVLPEVVVLDDLRGWSLRSYWPRSGWMSGQGGGTVELAPSEGDVDGAPTVVTLDYSTTLPLAVEITLETARHGTITIVESLR